MDIVVIGAGGSVGQELAEQIVAQRLLEKEQRLVLVGNPQGRSRTLLYGLAVDLMDAYAEICPRIEVVLDPAAIQGDIIVMAGGATIPTEARDKPASRDLLARHNFPIFQEYAQALAQNGHGHEIVICISNPNELAVAVFAHYLGRKRVLGMGAFLDSLRFRKEIAQDMGIRRQRIHGFMLGEHGFHTVPHWSGVHIYGYKGERLARALSRIRGGHELKDFHQEVAAISQTLRKQIAREAIREAFALIDRYPPDIRVVMKPFVTHFSGSKTLVGTARATLNLLRAITLGNDTFICGQLAVKGEFYGIHGTLGLPFVIGNQGVERIVEVAMSDEEQALLRQSAEFINEKLAPFMDSL